MPPAQDKETSVTARTRAAEADNAQSVKAISEASRPLRTQSSGVTADNPSPGDSRAHTPYSPFARPLNGLKVLQADHSAVGYGRSAAWALGGMMFGLLLGLSLPNGAQNAPAGRADTTGGAQRPLAVRPATPRDAAARPAANRGQAATSVDAQDDDIPTESRRPVNFYTQTVRGSLFSAPLLPAPKPPVVVVNKVPEVKPPPAPRVQTFEFNPLSSWSYTGTVTMGDQTMALLENQQSHEGQYVKIGDTFLGAKVVSVSDQMVTLKSGDKPTLLAKSDNITVTPFDRSAAPTSAQQTAQPPQPPQVTIQVGGQTFTPNLNSQQPTVTLPNGVQLTPDRAQRRNRRLNNNFNQ